MILTKPPKFIARLQVFARLDLVLIVDISLSKIIGINNPGIYQSIIIVQKVI